MTKYNASQQRLNFKISFLLFNEIIPRFNVKDIEMNRELAVANNWFSFDGCSSLELYDKTYTPVLAQVLQHTRYKHDEHTHKPHYTWTAHTCTCTCTCIHVHVYMYTCTCTPVHHCFVATREYVTCTCTMDYGVMHNHQSSSRFLQH